MSDTIRHVLEVIEVGKLSLGVSEEVLEQIMAEIARGRAIAQRAKVTLVKSSLRLVVHAAKKYAGRGVELLDRVQEGNVIPSVPRNLRLILRGRYCDVC